MQWGKADNENTAKQKADQAECEEMWTSSFKNQRQRWCKPGKSSSLHSGSLKNSVQNQNKTNKRLTISVRRKILEKFIWKNQKTVVVSCPRAAGNSQAVGSNLGWQRRDRSRNLIEGTQVLETKNFRLLQDVCCRNPSGDKASRLMAEQGFLHRVFCGWEAAPMLPNWAHQHLRNQLKPGRNKPNPPVSTWNLVHFGEETFSDRKIASNLNLHLIFFILLYSDQGSAAAEEGNVSQDVVIWDAAPHCLQTIKITELHFLMSWECNGDSSGY